MRRWPVVILLFCFSTPSVLGQYEVPPEPEAAPLGKPQKIFGDANMHKAQEEIPEISSPPDYVRPDNSPGEPLEHVGTPEVSAPGVETKDEAKEKSGEGIAAHKDGEYETKASAEEQVAHASAGSTAASETTASSTAAASAGVETSTAPGATTTGSAVETKGEGSYDSAVPAGDSKEAAPVAETPTTTTAEASTQAVAQETPKEAGYDAPEAPKAGSSAEAPKATSSEEVPKAESSGSAGDGYSAAASEGSAPIGTEAPKTDAAPSVSISEAPSGYDQPAAAAPPETSAPAVENKATGQKEEAVTTEASKEEATTAGSSEAPKSSESYSAPKESSTEATTTEASTTTSSSSGTELKATGDGYSDGKASAETGSAPSGTKGEEGAADVKANAGDDNGYADGKAEEAPKAEVNGSAPSGAADVKPSGSSEGGYGKPLTPAPSEETMTSSAPIPSAETKAQGEEPKEDDKIAAEIPKTACKPGEEGKTSEVQEKSKEASHEVEGSGDKSKETSSEEGAKKDKYVEHNDLNREGSGSSEVTEGSGLSAPADNSVTLAPEGTRNPPAAPTSAEIEAATLAPYPKSSEEEGSGNSIEAGDKYASKESAEGSGSKSGEEKSKSSEEGSGEEQPLKEEQGNSAEKGSSSSGPKSEGYSTDGEKHVEEPVIVNSPELPPVKPEEAIGYEGISKEDFRADIPQPKQELSQNSDVKIVEKQTQPTISSSSSASPLEQNRKTWIPYRFDCETEEDDKGPLCKEWAEGGLCEQHKPTMFLFCRRTCLCTGPFARRRRHALLS